MLVFLPTHAHLLRRRDRRLCMGLLKSFDVGPYVVLTSEDGLFAQEDGTLTFEQVGLASREVLVPEAELFGAVVEVV